MLVEEVVPHIGSSLPELGVWNYREISFGNTKKESIFNVRWSYTKAQIINHYFNKPVSQHLYAHACGTREIYKSDLKVHGTRGIRGE